MLKQLFLLDCLVRSEGLYSHQLYEQQQLETTLESELEATFDQLYDKPLAEQVEAYLAVPFSKVQEAVPQWKTAAYVEPNPEDIESIPYVVNNLGIVRTASSATLAESSQEMATSIERGFLTGVDRRPRILHYVKHGPLQI